MATVEEGARRLAEEISLAQPYHSALVYAADQNVGRQLAQQFRRAPNQAQPAVLCAARGVDLPRFATLSAGYTAVLELQFKKPSCSTSCISVSAGEDMHEGVVRLEDYAKRGAGGQKLRVLVADDNATNREVISRILERGGHAVTAVNDGEDALDALDQAQYDIVLLDRNMPGMGGIETLQAIRLMGRGLERVPVLVLSADVDPGCASRMPGGGRRCLHLQAHSRRCGCSRRYRSTPAVSARQCPLLVRRHTRMWRARSAPAAAALAPAQVLNHETLGHLEELGSGREFLERLFGVFSADNLALLKKVELALAARNTAEFRNLLHAMKGSAASMGAERLTRLCTSMGGVRTARSSCSRRDCWVRSARSSTRCATRSETTWKKVANPQAERGCARLTQATIGASQPGARAMSFFLTLIESTLRGNSRRFPRCTR